LPNQKANPILAIRKAMESNEKLSKPDTRPEKTTADF